MNVILVNKALLLDILKDLTSLKAKLLFRKQNCSGLSHRIALLSGLIGPRPK